MKIALVTPAAADSTLGNGVTAGRWTQVLGDLGHSVRVWRSLRDAPPDADLLVALHARRSALAVRAWRQHCGGRPLVLALTGTDLYADLPSNPDAKASVAAADRLVVLQDRAPDRVVGFPRDRIHVIHQSVPAPSVNRTVTAPGLNLCVLAHLRRVKDPLRIAAALRLVPTDLDVSVTLAGAVLEPEYSRLVEAAAADDPRVQYVGELERPGAAELLRTSDGIVVSSLLEGGANVVGEAIVGGIPVLASRIDGNLGLLGGDYEGYFPAEDTAALARLVERLATDSAWVARLESQLAARRFLFSPARERAAWRDLLAELVPS